MAFGLQGRLSQGVTFNRRWLLGGATQLLANEFGSTRSDRIYSLLCPKRSEITADSLTKCYSLPTSRPAVDFPSAPYRLFTDFLTPKSYVNFEYGENRPTKAIILWPLLQSETSGVQHTTKPPSGGEKGRDATVTPHFTGVPLLIT